MVSVSVFDVDETEAGFEDGESSFQTVVNAVNRAERYFVISEDVDQQIVWVYGHPKKIKYNVSENNLEFLFPYLNHLIRFGLSIEDECVKCVVYRAGPFGFTRIDSFEEEHSVLGKHCVNYVEKLLDLELTEFWDWDAFTEVYPLAVGI